MKLPIPQIQVGERHRKDMGDIDALAASIQELGLMQPIGVTEDHVLIFGERRLRACRKLGWQEIDVRVIDMPQIVVGENAENEVRKDFTPSERVAIARAIADEIGSRQGARTELVQEIAEVDGAAELPQYIAEAKNPQEIAEIKKGQKTSDFAAKKAGFGNRETFRQAESVVNNAEPELVDAMDAGKVSILAAHRAAKQPPEVQREIAKTGKTPREMYAELNAERREATQKLHPLVKVESIISAMNEIRDCGMSASEFKRLARGSGMEAFHAAALPVLAFIKEIVEVGNDQTRAG